MGRCQKCETEGQIDSNDVFYTGSYLPDLDIQTNTNFTQVLQKINDLFGGNLGLNIQSGNFVQSSDGLTLIYQIPHNLGGIPTGISVQSLNQNSPNFTVSYNFNYITITYTVAPSLGDQISLSWIAIKI